MTRNGAQLLVQALEAAGVRTAFGLPGTQNVPTFEALRASSIRTISCVHELAASFMANGYARASGEPGVLFTIPGPGFTYALPGLAEARLDSAPLLHVVGTARRPEVGRFAHQSIPQADMVRPLVKAVFEVSDVGDLCRLVPAALGRTVEGEPGPVVLHLHPDVQSAEEEVGGAGGAPALEVAPDAPPPDAALVQALAERVAAARRPILFAGQGASAAAQGLRALAETLRAPLFTTVSGRGVLPEDHPLALGFDPERGGVEHLNALIAECDLVLALGCRMGFNGTAGFALRLPQERLAHVNTDVEATRLTYPAGLAVVGRVEDVLPGLLARVGAGHASTWSEDDVAPWRERIHTPQRADPPEPRIHGVEGESAAGFFRALRRALPPEAVVVTDSGLHQALTRRHHEVRSPRGLLAPADFQSMGFGLPAAIGARLADPSRPVVAVIGDGGLAMSAMELLTAARERVCVTVVVFNDGYLGLIRMHQIREYGRTHAVDVGPLDVARVAAATGAAYALVEGDLERRLGQAMLREGPTLLEVAAGDTTHIRLTAANALARAGLRRVLGPSVVTSLKRLLGRG